MRQAAKPFFLFLFFTVIIYSCSQPSGEKKEEMPDTPTSGKVTVYCDEGFSIPMKLETYTFEQLYTNAKVDVRYVNEKEAIEGLYNDCCKVSLVSRCLSEDELKKFKAANLFPRQLCIAKNAVAFVTAVGSTDSTLSFEKIKALLSGADTSYNMVFANSNSGVAKFLKDSLLQGKPFGKNCFAVNNTNELVHEVSTKRVIGIMDYSWLSDKDETITKELLTKIRPLAVAAKNSKTAWYPDQSNIETGNYPFVRYMHILRRSADFTLGAGFSVFVAGQKGQLMILKSGLVPGFKQERVVEINTAPLGNQ